MSHFQQEKFVEIASKYLNLTNSEKIFEENGIIVSLQPCKGCHK